ncbi:MAG: 50S ribosomal protein L15 [Deltaproteobacteria bacterium RBG_19FT_COMBO_52_11]|nr:MAG: 50S ribosomal protein L15 [Deltaproteobacteria bacterium RBG_19FT_COMBO_52_11]
MKLNDLRPPRGARKKRKRIGRGEGSGHGGTSTKGHKGLKARSGGTVSPGYEGGQMSMQRRLPKRGFKNPFRKEYTIINVQDLARFPAGTVVDLAALEASGLVKRVRFGVKVLGEGDIAHPLTVRAQHYSLSAKSKIEAAGGRAEVI